MFFSNIFIEGHRFTKSRMGLRPPPSGVEWQGQLKAKARLRGGPLQYRIWLLYSIWWRYDGELYGPLGFFPIFFAQFPAAILILVTQHSAYLLQIVDRGSGPCVGLAEAFPLWNIWMTSCWGNSLRSFDRPCSSNHPELAKGLEPS